MNNVTLLGRHLRDMVALSGEAAGIWVVCFIAAAYGVVHALGPGHQKTLVAGYLLAKGGGPLRALFLSLYAAIAHAGSVLVLFLILLALDLGFGADRTGRASTLATIISGYVLVFLASTMLFSKIRLLINAFRDGSTESCSCSACSKKDSSLPFIIFAGSLAPCPGAAFFILYGFSIGKPFAGVVAVLSISLGMWLTLFGAGLLAITVRRSISVFSPRISAMVSVLGSFCILVFALALIL